MSQTDDTPRTDFALQAATERVRALEHGHALLKDVRRRVLQARVDVAKLLEGKELCRVLGRLEDKGRGTVERHAARGGAVGAVASVKAQRVERRILACHLAIMDCKRAHLAFQFAFCAHSHHAWVSKPRGA